MRNPAAPARPAGPSWPVLCAALLLAGCSPQNPSSPDPSSAASEITPPSGPGSSVAASVSPASAPPASAAATPVPTPTGSTTEAFQSLDDLSVGVNRLAARIAPKRTAAIVHAYNLRGSAPMDGGLVRLSKGDRVTVQIGPLQVGTTVWYLVSPAGKDGGDPPYDWYSGPPGTTDSGPAWVAASVDAGRYLNLSHRPTAEQLADLLPLPVAAAGVGPYDSAPQPRHDLFLADWAAATPTQGTSCSLKVTLVPADATFAPKVAVDTSTTTVKVSPLAGQPIQVPWLPAPEGSWKTFTVRVDGTCRWALRLSRLEHD